MDDLKIAAAIICSAILSKGPTGQADLNADPKDTCYRVLENLQCPKEVQRQPREIVLVYIENCLWALDHFAVEVVGTRQNIARTPALFLRETVENISILFIYYAGLA